MIAVTCRNGEHFTLNADAIERVEDRGDTWVVLGDGTKYVVGQTLEDLVRMITDHRAAALSARRLLSGPPTAPGHVPGRPARHPAADPIAIMAIKAVGGEPAAD